MSKEVVGFRTSSWGLRLGLSWVWPCAAQWLPSPCCFSLPWERRKQIQFTRSEITQTVGDNLEMKLSVGLAAA